MRLLREQRQFQLAPHGLSSADLAGRMGISQRQAQRDIIALECELGMPFVKQGSRYRLVPGYFLPPINFSVPEAVAVLLSARLTARFADRFNPFVESAYEKIGTVLPEPLRPVIAEVADSLGEKRRDDLYVRAFMTLASAWAERRKVELTYTLPGRFTRTVWPLFLEPSLSGHALYLIGFEEKRRVVRSYKLDRIADVQPTEAHFDPPLGFSVGRMLAHSWGLWTSDDESPVDVELLFSPAAGARVKETVWHPSQKLDQLADGRVRMRVLVSSLIEIRPWVLGWGADCQVLRPVEFAREIASVADAMATMYSGSSSVQSDIA